MAPVQQEPAITLAQRLASNDKPIRSKALKTLRKYISVRSHNTEGGFTSEDLLKIWKGLFYCLWMQDKALVQEELSHRISGLIHSFHTTDNQLLYFATFLQTVKREWNGIDRLRLDKFFQLVRFMFRQAFEVLRRREWESSVVDEFLQVFTEQLLQNTDCVPKGLMLHVLDLYMVELAQIGSAELTAEQNLSFIDPFCKTMAKTKDRFLLTSISKNIFRTIVDHMPYAIEDLRRELQQAGGDNSDSDQASGEEEHETGEEEELKNKAQKKTKVKKVNGISEVVENSQQHKDDVDLESMGSEESDGVGPVLQFDYGAVADRLFELGSHLNTRNFNRTKMYNLVKTFRDLSEGVFSQKEDHHGDMNNTSDDEIFNKKKKNKKKKRKNKSPRTEDETVAKKSKACQGEQKPSDSVQDSSLNDTTENLKKTENEELSDAEKAEGETVFQQNKSDSQTLLKAGISVMKKRKSKKLKTDSQDIGEQGQSCADHKPEVASFIENHMEAGEAECGMSLTQEKTKKNKKKKMNLGEKKTDTQTSGQLVEKPPQEISLHGQLETTETEVDKKSQGAEGGQFEASTMVRKKNRKSKLDIGEGVAVQSLPKEHNAGDEIRKLSKPQKVDDDNNTAQSQLGTSSTHKKVTIKKVKSTKEVKVAVKSTVMLEDTEDISRHLRPTSEENSITQCRLKAETTKKKKSKKLMSSSQECKEVDSTSQDSCAEVVATDITAPAVEVTNVQVQPSETPMERTKKSKKKKAKVKIGMKLQIDLETEVSSDRVHITTNENKDDPAEGSQPTSVTKAKKKKLISSTEEEATRSAGEAASTKQTHTPGKKKKTQKKQEIQPAEETREEPILKKTVKKKAGTEVPDTVPSEDICTTEVMSLTPMKKGKKKRKLQTDEAEMSESNGHADGMGENKVKISDIEVSTPVTSKKLKMEKASPKSDFVSFQGVKNPPTPLFYKTKPKGNTPLSSIKQKFQTPKSESKKVTFGLKNNKTTEFRKTDRSLLVSPVGSSRVAFDPKKMPVSGVLKSPSPSPDLSVKNPAAKKRPTAADFF